MVRIKTVMVSAKLTHGVDPLSYFCSSQCSTTGVTKAVVCVILSVGCGI